MSIEDKRVLAVMESSAKLVDGHHQLALLWREPVAKLPNNRVLAERRLQLLKKFLRDSELLEKYKATIQDYTFKGHAKRIPEDKLVTDDKPLWCLPHHPVFNPNKTGKTRVDADCTAKFKRMSLKDQLLNGPDLANGIMGMLTRFRQEQVALTADEEATFHQVRVSPDDYDTFRFLWWPDNDLDQEPVDYRMEVHLFGATSSSVCSNFALRKAAEDNIGEFDEKVVKTVRKNFYVDNCSSTMRSPLQGLILASQVV